jgi:hypothetical protein
MFAEIVRHECHAGLESSWFPRPNQILECRVVGTQSSPVRAINTFEPALQSPARALSSDMLQSVLSCQAQDHDAQASRRSRLRNENGGYSDGFVRVCHAAPPLI